MTSDQPPTAGAPAPTTTTERPPEWMRPRLRLQVALGAAVATFLVIGVPTDIVPNPVFGRAVPVRSWEPLVLLATSVLTGVWFGLQQPGAAGDRRSSAPALGGAGLAMFAVACPVCNKVVLLALGASGALGVWQPLQPWLAGVSLAMLAGSVLYAARRRPCADDACAVTEALSQPGASDHAPAGSPRS